MAKLLRSLVRAFGWKKKLVLALVAGAAVIGFTVAARKIAQPIHARGWARLVTSMVDSVAGVVEAPGREVVLRRWPARLDRFRNKGAVLLNFAFWSAAIGVWLALGGVGPKRVNQDEVEPAGRHDLTVSASRRRFLGRALQGTAAGNHDWHESEPTLREAFPKAGIPMLDNTRLFVRPDRTLAHDAEAGLCIAGVGDYWHDRQLYDAALGGLPDSMPRLLLSHNPDVAEDHRFLASNHRVDLMISGHTHGGQVKLPGVGALVTYSHYGKKYLHGLAQGPACLVHISAGVGMSKMPVRLGVPPEIVVFEFTSIG